MTQEELRAVLTRAIDAERERGKRQQGHVSDRSLDRIKGYMDGYIACLATQLKHSSN